MFIDIHAHAMRHPIGGKKMFSTAEEVLRRYDQLGVDKGVLLPLISPEFYEPQSNWEILETVEAYPDRFIPFCNIDPRSLGNSSAAPLGEALAFYKDKGCKGVGEITANLPFDHPMVWNLFACAEKLEMPVIFHVSTQVELSYGLVDDPGLPKLRKSLKAFPKLKFLGHSMPFWVEIAPLKEGEKRSGYPTSPVDAEGALHRLFRENPNLYGDLSAGSGCNALTRDRAHAAKFLTEFQDQMLFGLDICAPNDARTLPDFLNELKASGEIDRKVFDKVARENARKMLGL